MGPERFVSSDPALTISIPKKAQYTTKNWPSLARQRNAHFVGRPMTAHH